MNESNRQLKMRDGEQNTAISSLRIYSEASTWGKRETSFEEAPRDCVSFVSNMFVRRTRWGCCRVSLKSLAVWWQKKVNNFVFFRAWGCSKATFTITLKGSESLTPALSSLRRCSLRSLWSRETLNNFNFIHKNLRVEAPPSIIACTISSFVHNSDT